jgi:hypothetical protein
VTGVAFTLAEMNALQLDMRSVAYHRAAAYTKRIGKKEKSRIQLSGA